MSYLIVDDADMEMEMAKDPFLEAGIAIPAELPYQDDSQRENSARMVLGERGSKQFHRLESVAVLSPSASHQVASNLLKNRPSFLTFSPAFSASRRGQQ